RGRMVEFRTDDLRFQLAEASVLLGTAHGLGAVQVEQLCHRTEGWAAGLVLAGLSLQHSADPQGFVDLFGGDDRLVVDYLTDELLEGLADGDRETLVAGAIVDRLCGPLVDHLTGRSDGARWLDQLAATNQLLRPPDSTGTWYRHHQLMLDLLRTEAARSLDDRLPDLHRRAATWLGEHGEPETAVRHLVLAGDVAQAAAALAAGLGWRLIAIGAADTLQGLLADIGDVAERITGCVLQASWCALLRNEIGVADERLARARAMREDDHRAWDPLYDALEINIALFRGDVAAALDIARPVRSAGALADVMSPMATSTGSALAWAGRLDEARHTLEIARRRAAVDGVTTNDVLAWIYLALVEAEIGTRSAAHHAADRALESARRSGLAGYPRLALAHAVRAATADDAREAASDVERALELARGRLGALDAGYVHAIAADVGLAAGAPDGGDLLRRAQEITDRCQDPGVLGSRLRRVRDRHRLAEPAPTSGPGPVAPLTERELAVLRLLPGRLSQRQIAAELFVSLNTVKTHSRGIFRKLAVGDRRQAVQCARELGLF
ncbi:MAG: LuxR C-terminal-related transcriptional regulator, partial [Pseudonocardia sp.]|nr:LuxR C-terminal-related transcriptional regulator [Pseudonocardia sp.]